MANCAYHPDREVVGACVSCGRLICAECKVVLGDKIYCNPCADKLVTGASTPPEAKELNWFQKHLNWTYTLGLVMALVLAFIILGTIDPYAAEETVYLVIGLISFIVMLPMSVWVLKRKNRSLWWLLLALLFWLSLLLLGNKSNQA